ncbi:MAG: ribosomal protein S18 acetylase RimI-like enzyme [Oceanicoccus sp.]|jgi:ribosomal protein S18 acetylase RimI-like enzyme
MANLAESANLFVAEDNGNIVGGVALVPPNDNPSSHFDKTWAAIRMLVVSTEARGKGLGRALTEACIEHAKQSQVKTIGLHTSPIMEIALAIYQRMGFEKFKNIDPVFGVEYGVYKLDLWGYTRA